MDIGYCNTTCSSIETFAAVSWPWMPQTPRWVCHYYCHRRSSDFSTMQQCFIKDFLHSSTDQCFKTAIFKASDSAGHNWKGNTDYANPHKDSNSDLWVAWESEWFSTVCLNRVSGSDSKNELRYWSSNVKILVYIFSLSWFLYIFLIGSGSYGCHWRE